MKGEMSRKQSKIGYNTMGNVVIESNSQHCGIPRFKIVYNRPSRTHKLFYHALHEKTSNFQRYELFFQFLNGDLAVFRIRGVVNVQICHRTTMVQQWLKSFSSYQSGFILQNCLLVPLFLSESGFVTGLWMIETIGPRLYLIHLTWSGLKS